MLSCGNGPLVSAIAGGTRHNLGTVLLEAELDLCPPKATGRPALYMVVRQVHVLRAPVHVTEGAERSDSGECALTRHNLEGAQPHVPAHQGSLANSRRHLSGRQGAILAE